MSATSAPATPLPAPAGLYLRDFPDRLSPMLVKELRQGLRSGIFVWAFIAMHFVLAFIVLASLESESRRDTSTLFWLTIVVPIVFLLPLRGFNALTDEIRMHTMDTLSLTRLTAWRICFGKWVSIALQILLIGVTILPYLVMRYFTGGIDVALELRFLVHFIMLGCLLAATIIGFSWMKFYLFRGAFCLGWGFLAAGFCTFAVDEVLARQSYDWRSLSKHEWEFTFVFYFIGAYLIYYLLEFAAAQIAPASENRSSLRRVISLIMLELCSLAPLLEKDYLPFSVIIGLGVLTLAGFDALTENCKHVSVIVHPFIRRGWLGRLAGRLLYPGWHTGINFFLVLSSIAIAGHLLGFSLFSSYRSNREREEFHLYFLFAVAVIGQCLLGVTIQRLFLAKFKAPFVVFILLQAVLFGFVLLLAILADTTDFPNLLFLGAFSPSAAVAHFFMTEFRLFGPSPNENDHGHLAWVGVLAVVYLIIAKSLSRREKTIMLHLERECQLSLEQERLAASRPSETASTLDSP